MSTVLDKVHIIPVFVFVCALCLLRPRNVRLPDGSDLPDLQIVAALLVYVDHFLAAGPRENSTTSPHQTSGCVERK